jgi:DNA invertase Pin-like site-specific DNA recombinase
MRSELIRERVKAEMADAKKRGVGRRHTLRPGQRAEAARMHEEGKSIGAIAALLGCGRTRIF